MRTVKAWAIVMDGTLCTERTPSFCVYPSKSKAQARIANEHERIVRVEIREVKPKRKRAGGEG
jgi:hypothetical protein